MKKTIGAAAVLLTLTVGTPTLAANQPNFLGTWKIASSQPAPWATPADKPVESDIKALVGARLVFEAKRIVAPRPLTCANPNYEMKDYPADYLFQGSLTEPDKQATALGYHLPTIKTLETGCAGAFDFHFLDENTAMFGLNNRLYRMERQGK